MITRVWGVINSTNVEFNPIKGKDGYWEGYAPRIPGYQNVEIWAQNDEGRIGTLKCQALISYHTETTVRLVISPYYTQLVPSYSVMTCKEDWRVRLV